jgi:hypothetical protein
MRAYLVVKKNYLLSRELFLGFLKCKHPIIGMPKKLFDKNI